MAAPTVTTLTPSTGTSYGSTAVVILGTGFTGATAVKFGGVNAETYTVYSATIIAAVSPPHAAGAVSVEVKNADGTSASGIQFTYSQAAALFTVEELRSFRGSVLGSTVNFSEADIIGAEARVRAAFTDICGVYFIPTSTAERADGMGNNELLVAETKVSAVTACETYNSNRSVCETFDAADLTDLAIYPGGIIIRCSRGFFSKGRQNVLVTYTHGFSAVPGDIKRAALMVALSELTMSNVGDRTTSFSDGNMTYQLATAGRVNQWFGLPLVDSVLARYRRIMPVVL
jgi:hypothetical protein